VAKSKGEAAVESVCATFRTPDGVEYVIRAGSAEAAAAAVRVLQAGPGMEAKGAEPSPPQPTEVRT
jgi:hypothetical protein